MVHPYRPEQVAGLIAEQLATAYHRHGRAVLAVPGGRSPGEVVTCLAGILGRPVREHLHLFWVDERGVPVGDPRRNDGNILRSWELGGPLPGRIHPMPAQQADLAAAATAYAAELEGVLAGQGLDVVLLGLGEDGHLASLFPGHAALADPALVVAVTDSPQEPARRLSLGLRTLAAARFRVVLALGGFKAGILRRVVLGTEPDLPAVRLPSTGTHWYADAAASSGLGSVR